MELGASLLVVIPLILTVLFIAVEMVHAHMIQTVLSQAAEKAAHDFAYIYGSNPDIADNASAQEDVYQNIRSTNIINANEQFQSVFATTSDPRTVTVTVSYLGGQYGLTPFPQFDPLNLGSNFNLQATATYRLE